MTVSLSDLNTVKDEFVSAYAAHRQKVDPKNADRTAVVDVGVSLLNGLVFRSQSPEESVRITDFIRTLSGADGLGQSLAQAGYTFLGIKPRG